MAIAEKLSELVGRAGPVDELLESAVRLIADELHADTCSLFLLEADGHLVRRAIAGDASHAAAAQAAAEGLAGVAMTQMLPETREESSRSLVAVPMALRGHPMGVIVVQASRRPAYTAAEIAALFAVAAQMVAVVESARLHEAVATRTRPHVVRPAKDGELVLRGVPVSGGVAIGSAAFRGAVPTWLATASPGSHDPALELACIRDAFTKTRNDLAHIQENAARDLGEEHAFIFASHLAMLADPTLDQRIEHAVVSGWAAPEAVDRTLLEVADRLRGVNDPYLQERTDDVEDLRARLLGHLLPSKPAAAPSNEVVVSPRIAPSLVMEMKAQASRGIVAESGGATSHGALLARALGMPAVAGGEHSLDAIDVGDMVVVDGSEGVVVVRPTAETLARYEGRVREEAHRRTEFERFRGRSPTTADGVGIVLQANVSFGADVASAVDNGAAGIGLYRTEFPFIARAGFPTRDEQVRIYRKAYDAFPEEPVTLRVLDLAGDKFVSSRMAAARGAFHGYRSIRVLFDHPHVLRDQVQAFALAAEARPLRVLVPMVSSVEELLRIEEMTRAALQQLPDPAAGRDLHFGAMIEVPAAVEILPELAAYVDFFSIGTNDLIQYALVVDREDARMSSPDDAYHPAVLRMIRRVVVAAHARGKPVTVCGEMAAHPDLALALTALGADALSITPVLIPELKQAFATTNIEPLMAEGIERVLAAVDARSVRAALRAELGAPKPKDAA